MKGILVIMDGLGDLPHTLLGGKTPLEAANTPNMDFFATRGELGYMYTVKEGFIPESDEAIVSIFGNDISQSSRGQIEAKGVGLKLMRGDLALRANFATIDSLEKGNIIDRRAGRTLTTKEAELLARDLNKINMPVKFEFKPTVQHRGVLAFKGGFSDSIGGNDSTYFQGKFREVPKISQCKPSDDDENAQYSANVVNEFLEKAFKVLNSHPVNDHRRNRGLLPANYLLVRGAGSEPLNFKQYEKWFSFSYMPTEIGFSLFSGMKPFSFEYPALKNLDSYSNLWEGLTLACKLAIKCIKKHHDDYDYAYIHIKETDLPGHDNKPIEKKNMLEFIDGTLFKFLRNFAPPKQIKVVATGDHSTPCRLKAHSADPVPVLLYNFGIPKERHFNEKEAMKGSLGRVEGKDFLKKIGFDK